MFLETLQVVRGYVEIKVTGTAVARFINLAARRQIYIWDVRSIEGGALMKVSIKGFRNLRECAHKTKSKIKITQKRGLPFFLYKYRKRKFLFFGIIFLIAAMTTLTSFVWLVEIEGADRLSREEILEKAAELGLKSGKLKYTVNASKIEKGLMDSFSDISWIDVRIKGTEATIRMTESIPKPKIHDGSPCNVIAKKDGLIVDMATISGTPLVKERDVVKKGELLVSSEILVKEGGPIERVAADAEIYAKIYYETKFKVPFYYKENKFTGETKSNYKIDLFNKEFNIPRIDFSFLGKNKRKSDFEAFETVESAKQLRLSEKYPLPLIFIAFEDREYTVIEKVRSAEEARAYAEKVINRKIIEEFDFSTDVLDKVLDFTDEEDGVLVEATISAIERIDEKVPIE
jgi:similar to stage IV sporulation protein